MSVQIFFQFVLFLNRATIIIISSFYFIRMQAEKVFYHFFSLAFEIPLDLITHPLKVNLNRHPHSF